VDDAWFAISPEALQAIPPSRLGNMYQAREHPVQPATAPPVGGDFASESPGGSFRGTARALGRFYEMMLAGGVSSNRRIILKQTVEALIARHRVGIHDQTLG